eukprot:3805666-Rhodomonas_salina.1
MQRIACRCSAADAGGSGWRGAGCFALSEPSTGSDAGAQTCTATKDGDGWVSLSPLSCYCSPKPRCRGARRVIARPCCRSRHRRCRLLLSSMCVCVCVCVCVVERGLEGEGEGEGEEGKQGERKTGKERMVVKINGREREREKRQKVD